MRIVVDSNIVFSAILNSDSKIGRIILHLKSRLNFYTTDQLFEEIENHKDKIKSLSGFSEYELEKIIKLITKRIRFINIRLVPSEIYKKAENLTRDIDIDDTEFVALAEHAKAKLWSGDKKLIQGLKQKNWNNGISTEELFNLIIKNKKFI
jgi:putative PIN family toxin of toxin-antitoxin system